MTDEQGHNILISKLIGLIMGLLLIFVLLYILYLILIPKDLGDLSLPQFQFTKLIKDINDIKTGNGKLLTYSSSRNFMLVGFNKNLDIIKKDSLSNECGKYPIALDIEKQKTCYGKGCLCLCNVDTTLASEFGGDLIVNCKDEDVKCSLFEQNVIANNNCNYLLYYHTSQDAKKLLLSKDDKDIIITPQP